MKTSRITVTDQYGRLLSPGSRPNVQPARRKSTNSNATKSKRW
ncbi:hypothetical protein O9993_02300 [Vibrio lentus]|nr:hypothetical protein [Vibrio lentus]